VGARCSGGNDGPSGRLRQERRWVVVELTDEQRRVGDSRAEVKMGQCGCERRRNGARFL
jgi:hypothetical protein